LSRASSSSSFLGEFGFASSVSALSFISVSGRLKVSLFLGSAS
jgi:hypothetical protein